MKNGTGAPHALKKVDAEPMPLTTGTRIGPYEVTGWIGAGGSACGRRVERVGEPRRGQRVGVVLTGGNVDAGTFAGVLGEEPPVDETMPAKRLARG